MGHSRIRARGAEQALSGGSRRSGSLATGRVASVALPMVEGSGRGQRLPFQRWELVLGAGVVAILAAIAINGLSEVGPYDFGGYYGGAPAAILNGNPWSDPNWVFFPFVAPVMAVVSKLFTVDEGAWTMTVLNILSWAALLTTTWAWLRRQGLGRAFWWVSLFAAVAYGPVASSVWWKQTSLPIFAFCVLGFAAIRRGRPGVGGFLVGAALAFKPFVPFLPLALLAWRQTRRAGLIVVGWFVGLSFGGLGFLAWRGHDLGLLDPFDAYRRVSNRIAEPAGLHVCNAGNVSPLGVACRALGSESFGAERLVVTLAVVALGVVGWRVLRDEPGTSWRVFAFACLLSPLLAPTTFPHEALLLVSPMFVLLTYEFRRDHASRQYWAALVGALLLADLDWTPGGTALGRVKVLLLGRDNPPLSRGAGSTRLRYRYGLRYRLSWWSEPAD